MTRNQSYNDGPYGIDFGANPVDDRSLASQMDVLARFLRASEPPDLPPFLASMRQGVPYAAGTSVRSISPGYRRLTSGLVVPGTWQDTQPMDLIGTWVALEDYLPVDPRGFFDRLAGQFRAIDLLVHLSMLNRYAAKPRDWRADIASFAKLLPEEAEQRLGRSMAARLGEVRVVARQPLLFAIKRILSLGVLQPTASTDIPIGWAAILLSHAAASLIDIDRQRSNVVFGNVPEGVLMDMVRLGAFGRDRTALDQMSWYWDLWTEHSSITPDPHLPASPLELLRQASGLDPAAIWALGLWFVGEAVKWSEGNPFLMGMPRNESCQAEIDRFISAFSMTVGEAIEGAATSDDPWNYRFLEDHPIVRLSEGLLIPDEALLLDRFTSGLYWLVADTLGQGARDAWRRTYSRMTEDALKRQLESIAPRSLVPASARLVFDENAIQAAFGGKASRPKAVDIAVDFGDTWLLAEIVTRNLQVGTRIRGEFACLEADIEAGVLGKVPQITETARLLLEQEDRLTGRPAPQGRRIVPVIVAAEAFPLEPTGWGYIRSRLATDPVLSDPRVRPLCLLDIDDFDYLEALVQEGHSPVELLVAWKEGDLQGVPFRKYARDNRPIPKTAFRVTAAGAKMLDAIRPLLD